MPLRVLTDVVIALAGADPGRALIRVRQSGKYVSIGAREFAERTLSLAAGLERIGVRPGDRVALIAENRPEWPATDLATLLLGGVTVPLYPTLPEAQCRTLIEHSGARVAVASTPEQMEKIRGLPGAVPTLETVIVMDPPDPLPEGILAWNRVADLGAGTGAADVDGWRNRTRGIRPEDPASIIYTSGTTGEPKGVVLTHANFCSNLEASAEAIPIGPGDTLLSFLPLSHVFQRMVDFICLARGATVAYSAPGDSLMDDFRAARPTIVPTVPRVLEKIRAAVLDRASREPKWRQALFRWALAAGRRGCPEVPGHRPLWAPGRLQLRLARRLVLNPLRERLVGREFRFFISGAAALPLEVGTFFASCGIPVLEGYGLTETSPVIAVNRPEGNLLGTVGRPVRGVEVRIQADGEVACRGPNVMQGYFRDEAATRAALHDGWFLTGDLGRLDADGYLRITDRKRDLIKTSGGKLIAPQPLESRLREDDLIAEAVLLGEGRRFIAALIVPDFDRLQGLLAPQGIAVRDRNVLIRDPRVVKIFADRIARRLAGCAPFETVKRFRLLPEPLRLEAGELTPTQKVRRARVAERYRKEIEEMYA